MGYVKEALKTLDNINAKKLNEGARVFKIKGDRNQYIEMDRDAFDDYESIAWSIGEFFYPDDEVACYVNDHHCSTAEAVMLLKADIDKRIKDWEAKYGIPFKAWPAIFKTHIGQVTRLPFNMEDIENYLALPADWKADPDDYEDLVY